MRRIFKSPVRRLYESGFKAGYKRALRESKLGMTPNENPGAFKGVVDSFLDTIDYCREEGEDSVDGIIDKWQQLYGDDYMYEYGDNEPIPLGTIAKACLTACRQAGIPCNMSRPQIAELLQSYINW